MFMNNKRKFFLIIILLLVYCLSYSEPFISGMGQKEALVDSYIGKRRVVLGKNLVRGVNKITQQMLDRYGSNTRFIIKYDYSIDGELLIPDNCELFFEGGSLRNGEVDFNFCNIISNYKVFYNIRFSHLGNFDIRFFDIPQDATNLLQDIVNSCKDVDLRYNSFNIRKVITIEGYGDEFRIRNGNINALEDFEIYVGEEVVPVGMMLYLHNISSGAIENVKLNGNRNAQRGFYIYQCKNFVIDKCDISGFDGKDNAASWGVRCLSCSDIKLTNSHISDIFSLPVGVVGHSLGSAKGVLFGNTYNSCIINNVIENVQSTKDGDALHINAVPFINGAAEPSRLDLYRDVNVIISNNVIKGNDNSKRCIKIQANGVKIVDNYIQKLFENGTNTISIYASNIQFSNNTIDSRELYAIGLGASYLDMIHDVVISNNIINHRPQSDWRSCIYMVESPMKNIVIDSNVVYISNKLNYFCDLRMGVDSFVVSNNKVIGGCYCFCINIRKDGVEITDLQLKANYYEGDKGFLAVIEKSRSKASYKSISVSDNTFRGMKDDAKMFYLFDNPEAKKCISLSNNTSNKGLGL